MSTVNAHPMQAMPPQHLMEQPYQNNEFLLQQLQTQVEFYFNPENLANDKFLQDQLSQTEHLGAVPIQVICSFRKIRQLYSFAANIPIDMMPPADPAMLRMGLSKSSVVSVSHDGMWIIPNNRLAPIDQDDAKDTAATVETASTPSSPSSQATGTSSVGAAKERNTIVIRDIPPHVTEQIIMEALAPFSPKSARPEAGNTWFVVFERNEDAISALSSDVALNGVPIRGCLKSDLHLYQQPPAMPLPPAMQTATGYPNMIPPPPYPGAFPQPYGFMPMNPYGMPMQHQPYRMQPQYYPPQPYGYYGGPPPPPSRQQRQTGIPPRNVFVRPNPPQRQQHQNNNNYHQNNRSSSSNNNTNNNNNYNNKSRNNKKNNNRRNRLHQNQQSKDSDDQSTNSRSSYNRKQNKNYDKNNAENKKQFKANRKKRNSPKAMDLSAEHFPALGGEGKQQPQQKMNGPAYAQALLKKPQQQQSVKQPTKPLDSSKVEKVMHEMTIQPAEDW